MWLMVEVQNLITGINKNRKNGLITLSVEYYSPFLAKDWVDKLVLAINKHIQQQDKIEAEKGIKYLEEKINETKIADMRNTFYKLIEEQRKTLMLAEVSDEYILKTISESKVPKKKSNPKRPLIVLLGTILGGVLSVLIVIILGFRKKHLKPNSNS